MRNKLIFIFLFSVSFSGFCQNGYESGLYVDKADSIHIGLIKYVPPRKWTLGLKFDSVEFNRFYFKENEKAKRLWIRPNMVNKIIFSTDTFEVLNVDPFTGSLVFKIIKRDDFVDFVKVLEIGKLNLYEHAHPFLTSSQLPIGSKQIIQYDYYFRKNGIRGQIEKGDELLQIEFGRKKVIRSIIEDDEVLLRSFDDGDYEKLEIRKLVRDYNSRAKGSIKPAKLVLIRESKKEVETPLLLSYNNVSINLPKNYMDTVSIFNTYDFTICIEGEKCQNLTSSYNEFIFMKVSKRDGNIQTSLSLMDKDEIKFYTTRILYLMEKSAKKKRK